MCNATSFLFTMKNFALRLRELRGNLTQQQIAEKVGLKQQNWARYESGQVVPGAEALRQICVSCGVSADWLLGLPGAQSPGGAGVAEMKVAALKGAIQAILDRF